MGCLEGRSPVSVSSSCTLQYYPSLLPGQDVAGVYRRKGEQGDFVTVFQRPPQRGGVPTSEGDGQFM